MFDAASPLDGLDLPAGFAERVGATPERLENAEAFRHMLVEANARMNLVGASTLSDFWMRHFVDSAQLIWFAPEARVWADLGAGAGLPGVILAILLKGRANVRVHLVESMAKRCAFLRDVVQALDLPAEVHHARAEHLKLRVDVVTARACAHFDRLLGYAAPNLRGETLGLFLKGEMWAEEVGDAWTNWRFDAVGLYQSLSDPRGQLIGLKHLRRARG